MPIHQDYGGFRRPAFINRQASALQEATVANTVNRYNRSSIRDHETAFEVQAWRGMGGGVREYRRVSASGRKSFWGAVTRVHGETRYTRERLREAGRMLPL